MKFGYREGLFTGVCFAIAVALVIVVYLKVIPNYVQSKARLNLVSYSSCRDVPVKVSGKYNIKVIFDSFEAYCEQEKYGGGWMVIQHRFDGSLSFERNWKDYRNGFGNVGGEHWLGLEKVYQVTKEHGHELLIELKDFQNNYFYARYNSFAIGSEAEHFRLNALGSHSGTAGDPLTHHKGMNFSTPDRDNVYSCAKTWQGGWWFNDCGYAFLNGLHRNAYGRNENKISWHFENRGHRDFRSYKFSRMLIRPLI